MPLSRPEYGLAHCTRPLVVHHARLVHVSSGKGRLMRPRNRGIDQLATLSKLVKSGLQLSQIVAPQTLRSRRRPLRRRGHRFSPNLRRLGRAVDRPVGRINPRNRRTRQRWIHARGRIVLAVAEISPIKEDSRPRKPRSSSNGSFSALSASSTNSSSTTPCGGCGAPSCQTA